MGRRSTPESPTTDHHLRHELFDVDGREEASGGIGGDLIAHAVVGGWDTSGYAGEHPHLRGGGVVTIPVSSADPRP
jgi:hypothetical protein